MYQKVFSRHENIHSPYSVAKCSGCRNKWEKNWADYLEWADKLRTFASELRFIHKVRVYRILSFSFE